MSLPSSAERPEPLKWEEAGRLPAPTDNAAIAIRALPAGARIQRGDQTFRLPNVVLEGHRFATQVVEKGGLLLSWGLPFGQATRRIEPGEYLCNEKILKSLAQRHVPFALPQEPNFTDYRLQYQLSEPNFRPGEQFLHPGQARSFLGYARGTGRGIGTRNYIVVLGTSSRTGAFARRVAKAFKEVQAQFPNIDGVVPVDHTEGGGNFPPHNFDLILRTLAGMMVNPNVAAVLAVDVGDEFVNNNNLRRYLKEQRYPIDAVSHRFLSIRGGFEPAFAEATKTVEGWLAEANRALRSEQPLSGLKIGLQCGGSDAFSGVSGNPVAGIVAREAVAYGGSANLAETSELIGAESYVLENVRDVATAKAFLNTLERFQEWAGQHGHSAEGNPSGGNMYRGLYNITIKSIGAARKKDPRTRLDYVINYGDRMLKPGFYFMDSPGNDLESIAGQVAAGCNLILFTTGNGSITNFPFVPTVKVMTTTARFELVRKEMDFNAGRYQDGEDLETLGLEAFEQVVRTASGQRSVGELAGHSQVQLWREWHGAGEKTPTIAVEAGSGEPLLAKKDVPEVRLPAAVEAGLVGDQVQPEALGLVLPTSLCSGQVALGIVDRLNAKLPRGLGRAVALPHTEGCGNSAGDNEQLFLRTMVGHLANPLVARALLLEHGCEKTHNDAFRNTLVELGVPAERLGWASIQLDGGLENVTRKALNWFDAQPPPQPQQVPLTVGFYGEEIPERASEALEHVWKAVLSRGGSVVSSENSWIEGRESVAGIVPFTLNYGQRLRKPGWHLMECPTEDPLETLTGLVGCGATLLLAYSDQSLLPGHPMVPLLQMAAEGRVEDSLAGDVDLVLDLALDPQALSLQMLRAMAQVRSGQRVPRSRALGNIGFQVTRGLTGISL